MTLPLFLLPNMAYAADVATRLDAIAGLVVCEEDYVSTWLTTTRNQWRMLGGSAFTILQTLNKPDESLFGCDGLIALHDPLSDLYKLMLFEAKVLKPSGMDKLQARTTPEAIWSYGTAPAYSHFADQLGRQHWWRTTAKELAIIEFFIDLRPPAAPFDKTNRFREYGSTCVLHENARNFVLPSVYSSPPYKMPSLPISSGHIWTQATVIPLYKMGSIQTALWHLATCKIGLPMRDSDGLKGLLIGLMQRQLPSQRNNYIVDAAGANLRLTSSLPDILQAAGIRFFAQFSGPSTSSWLETFSVRRN